jgi:hypothetical protein
LHIEELHNLYQSPDFGYKGDQIKEDEVARTLACMIDMINACNILIGKPGGKRLCGRPGCRWENYISIKNDLEEIV